MSANDYWIASIRDDGRWEVVNQRNRTAAGEPFEHQADARARADELNGAAFMAEETAA